MAPWSDFFPDVLQDVLGCPEPVVEQYLLRAAQDFCQQTLCWRQDLATITTADTVADYPIVFPTGADLVKLLDATLDGVTVILDAADSTKLADRLASRGTKRLLLRSRGTVTLMPTPSAVQSLILDAALGPSETATGLPDEIADQNRLAIADGALSRLLNINKAEWRNPSLALQKAASFQNAIGTAKVAAWKAYSRNRPRTVGSYF